MTIRATGKSTLDYRGISAPGLSLLLWMVCLACDAAGQTPVITEDPKHPGYYRPFRCLTVDRNVRGHWGAIRNGCGFDVEAHWQSAKGTGSSWTVPADDLHSLFEEVHGQVLGCLRNDHLNRSLGLCRGANLKLPSEAEKLARELGIQARPAGTMTNGTSEAASLAKELGIAVSPSSRTNYAVTELQNDLATWERRELLRKHEEEQRRKVREQQERLAAIERVKREEVLRAQQLAEARRQVALPAERGRTERQRGADLWDLLKLGAGIYVTTESARSNSESTQGESSSAPTPSPSSPASSSCNKTGPNGLICSDR